tara:strand:- start:8927 stop:9709 length:783 start_codon:yes stop_codon:yes gene_type:complete
MVMSLSAMIIVMKQEETTHFGYQEVPVSEKTDKVADVFTSVASRYDIMNDVMSFGLHRIWKQIAIQHGAFQKGHRVLDLAGGTGDLAKKISEKVGDNGEVILADINQAMLDVATQRLMDSGHINRIKIVQANAECLPFEEHTFDRIIIGFGLRNVTDKQQALKSMYHCLAPGGRLLILEFSQPISPALSKAYDFYSFECLPRMGEWIAKDRDSYQYLAESIRKHPDQITLQRMMETAGFEDCSYHNLSGGIVALHKGMKY